MPKTHRRTERLKERVAHWANRLKVKPRLVRIQRMTRKWGSCSTAGTITLAADLNDQEAGFQDFVITHELLHLRIPNHGRLFKALMTAHVPNWHTFDVIRRNAWSRSTGQSSPPWRVSK
jgi:predicted metal-dependent hydrolase